MKKLILASGSPSRREILLKAGYDFDVDPSNYEEDMSLKMTPSKLAVYLSKGKADDVVPRHSNSVILAADSFAVFDDKVLGKPHTTQKAREMLLMLSGKTHLFITGYTVVDSDNLEAFSNYVETKVYFNNLSADVIERYIEEENVLEVAGAYKIQGLGQKLIEKLEGDLENVSGLPIREISTTLGNFGISPKM